MLNQVHQAKIHICAFNDRLKMMPIPYWLFFMQFFFLLPFQTIWCQILLKYNSNLVIFCVNFNGYLFSPDYCQVLTPASNPWLFRIYVLRHQTSSSTSPFTSPTLQQSCFDSHVSCSLNFIKISLLHLCLCIPILEPAETPHLPRFEFQ